MSTAGVIIKLVSTFGEDGSSLKQVKESVFCSKKRKSLVPRMELKLEKEVETIGSESSRTVEAGLYSSCYELPSITFSFDLNYANLPLIHLEFEELELDRRELDKQEGLQLHLRNPRWVLRAIEPKVIRTIDELGGSLDCQHGKSHVGGGVMDGEGFGCIWKFTTVGEESDRLWGMGFGGNALKKIYSVLKLGEELRRAQTIGQDNLETVTPSMLEFSS
ncbi:hypothetical protein Tco_0033174 [Tanacetum coccineum]